jgi:hypothetical protein
MRFLSLIAVVIETLGSIVRPNGFQRGVIREMDASQRALELQADREGRPITGSHGEVTYRAGHLPPGADGFD